jgi:hypothetical protein
VTAGVLRPVYLAVPSNAALEQAMAPEFVDRLARDPATIERVAVGVVEFATFVNELAALSTSLEIVARAAVSGFAPSHYAALFGDAAALLDYDRYRFAERGIRLGPPALVVVVDHPAAPDDPWDDARRTFLRAGRRTWGLPPVIAAVSTRPETDSLAQQMCAPTGTFWSARPLIGAGEAAAALLLDVCGRPAGGSDEWIGLDGEPSGNDSERCPE